MNIPQEDIDQLRQLIGSPSEEEVSDEALQAALVAAHGIVRVAAASMWESKAASLTTLVDMSEGGSSRSNSQVYKNARAMADYFRGTTPELSDRSRTSRTRPIVRP